MMASTTSTVVQMCSATFIVGTQNTHIHMVTECFNGNNVTFIVTVKISTQLNTYLRFWNNI